jgi:hypothetical protein
VASVTSGTDPFGNLMIEPLFNPGDLWEYRAGTGWAYLDGGVKSIVKGHAGSVAMVFTRAEAIRGQRR